MPVQVRVGRASAGSRPPLQLVFQNGYITPEFTSEHAEVLSDNGRRLAVVECAGSQVLYTGYEHTDQLKTILLVRNKRNGKVRAIEVGTARMKANIADSQSVTDTVEVDNLELSRKFGSKKQKNQMEHREKLKISTKTVNEQLKNIAEATDTVSQLDLSTYMKTDSDDVYIPPINRDAANVKDVYRINDILSIEQIEKITSETEGKDLDSELIPYVKTFATNNLNDTERALLLYANTLLKLYLMTYKELIKKTFQATGVSVTLNELVLKNFTSLSNNKRTRPNQLKDKALCHAMVMLLILNGFKVELEAFTSTVKLAPATLTTKAKAVGAHVSNVADRKYIILKVPLNTAKVFSRRKSAKF